MKLKKILSMRAVMIALAALTVLSLCRCKKSGIEGLPVVSTSPATNVYAYVATCGGTVTDPGSAPLTMRGICWSKSHEPTFFTNSLSDGSAVDSVIGLGIYRLTNSNLLSPSSIYYIRAFAGNKNGIAYGDEVTIQTTAATELDFLSCSDWKYYSYDITTTGGGGGSSPLYSSPCLRDDIITFGRDHSYTVNDHITICNPSSARTSYWSLNTNSGNMDIGGTTFSYQRMVFDQIALISTSTDNQGNTVRTDISLVRR